MTTTQTDVADVWRGTCATCGRRDALVVLIAQGGQPARPECLVRSDCTDRVIRTVEASLRLAIARRGGRP